MNLAVAISFYSIQLAIDAISKLKIISKGHGVILLGCDAGRPVGRYRRFGETLSTFRPSSFPTAMKT
jgi:hypothetical protein